MKEYKVVVGPAQSAGSIMEKICGANPGKSNKDFQAIIDREAQDGWEFHSVFGHETEGKLCCIFPANAVVNLLVFQK
jgi:hypothetical protein